MLQRIIIILAIVAIAEYYSFIVIRSAIRNLPTIWRTTLMVIYLLVTALAWSGILLFRQVNWANVPHLLRNIYIALTLGLTVGKVLVLVVMLVDDLRRLVMWLISSFTQPGTAVDATAERGVTRSVFLSRLALIIGGTTVAGFLYGITNRYNYQVRRIKLKFKDLPASFKGMRIVQISDIHTGSFDNHNAVAHGIEQVLEQKPDIIFFTGDLVNNKAEEVDERYQQIFSRLKAPMGVYSILGNHDYGDYVQWNSQTEKAANLERLKNMQRNMGWRLLMNEHVILQRGEDKIAVVGIENWGAKAGFPKYGNMRKAYSGLPEQNIPFKILLSHDPSHWDAEVRPQYSDIQLTLSGHTHGMQLGIDSKILKWSPVQYVYKEWAGLYQEENQYIYVNRGFGFIGYPGRLGILPEITVIELE